MSLGFYIPCNGVRLFSFSFHESVTTLLQKRIQAARLSTHVCTVLPGYNASARRGSKILYGKYHYFQSIATLLKPLLFSGGLFRQYVHSDVFAVLG